MDKRTASNIEGMNPEKKPSFGAGINEEFANEPLTAAQRQHNKKKKKNQ
ncbi:small acid-soluble spore protein O [Bacillus sp. FJAT-49731]|uniref:Small acid-soluble spore protein O n=1 Tax=Lederbergia citrea TaxID=2833581 RepID=A0A942UR87_9BACI|nr:small acid-soluble spore protein O [Lederbergia citrea]MBS4224132.1 small acid-soluble spore protein O [Lederbergia citrea]